MLVVDKVYITYKSNYINFEALQQETTKSGKRKYKSFVNGQRWEKKTQLDKTGDIVIINRNSKELTVNISEIGFLMDVKRGSVFFQLNIILLSRKWNTTGLCSYVPTSAKYLITKDYEVYSSGRPIPGQTGTLVSETF